MKRTTIYLEPELEVLLKMEVLRRKQPMAEIVREAVYAYITREPRKVPPGAGEFASERPETAEHADRVLAETGFGQPAAGAPRTSPADARARRRRTTGVGKRARR